MIALFLLFCAPASWAGPILDGIDRATLNVLLQRIEKRQCLALCTYRGYAAGRVPISLPERPRGVSFYTIYREQQTANGRRVDCGKRDPAPCARVLALAGAHGVFYISEGRHPVALMAQRNIQFSRHFRQDKLPRVASTWKPSKSASAASARPAQQFCVADRRLAPDRLRDAFDGTLLIGRNAKGRFWKEFIGTGAEAPTAFMNADGKISTGQFSVRDGKACFRYGSRKTWSCKSVFRCKSDSEKLVLVNAEGQQTSEIAHFRPGLGAAYHGSTPTVAPYDAQWQGTWDEVSKNQVGRVDPGKSYDAVPCTTSQNRGTRMQIALDRTYSTINDLLICQYYGTLPTDGRRTTVEGNCDFPEIGRKLVHHEMALVGHYLTFEDGDAGEHRWFRRCLAPGQTPAAAAPKPVAALTKPTATPPAQSDPTDLAACAAVSVDAARLACFEALAAAAISATAAPPSAISATPQPPAPLSALNTSRQNYVLSNCVLTITRRSTLSAVLEPPPGGWQDVQSNQRRKTGPVGARIRTFQVSISGIDLSQSRAINTRQIQLATLQGFSFRVEGQDEMNDGRIKGQYGPKAERVVKVDISHEIDWPNLRNSLTANAAECKR